jgi:hypothetical protein
VAFHGFSAARVGFLTAIAAMAGGAADAQTAPPEAQAEPRVEFWSGAEAFQHVWSIYSGASFAPFGSVREDGFRLRGVAGYSDYGSGTVTFADLLLGYHIQLGPLTLKALAGITATNHDPEGPGARDAGLGGKAAIEAWWNITDRAWTSADLSWASLHSVYGARIRLGWRLWPELSAGIEGGSAGTPDRDIARLGGFVRYEWPSGELSISGGLAMDGPATHFDESAGAFGTISLMMRF